MSQQKVINVARGLEKAPNGIIGFETALAATITSLVDKGHIGYLDMVRLMSYNPAKILGIDKGQISEGKVADITISVLITILITSVTFCNIKVGVSNCNRSGAFKYDLV